MKNLTFLALSFALLALVSSCSTKTEAPKSDVNVPQAAQDATAASAGTVASDDGIFKYTITTDIDTEDDHIEILVAMNTVHGKYPVKYDLDCEGDGDFEYQGLTGNQKCIYKKNSGKHQIGVRGEIPAMFLCARRTDNCIPEDHGELCDAPVETDHSMLSVVSIDSWGNVQWKSMASFAENCKALDKLPEDSPELRLVKNMRKMFAIAESFNQPLENWDVSNVTDMGEMFSRAKSFNQPLENWNVSNVKNMAGMFADAALFNQPLEKWNVSNVTNMGAMFGQARAFNQPLDQWNVSNVTDMHWMFLRATSFNQPLENWNVSRVNSMTMMFSLATSFNQPLEKWDVSNVTEMDFMFNKATSFNQPLDQWNVSNVTNMQGMFFGAKEFSHYPKNWVVPDGDNAKDMFTGTKVEEEAKKTPLKTK